ncbi:MAG: bacterial transcriptional activator domain-containing protein [Pseudomonadota bacterium]
MGVASPGAEAREIAPTPGWLSFPCYAVVALLAVSYSFTEMMGSDLWWHLAAGREMFERGTIRLVEDWSYTAAGEVWRNHEWLADVVYHGWVSAFGVTSLVYWKWLMLALIFGFLQRALLRLGEPAAALLACLAAMAIAAPFIDIRPQLYSLLGIAVLLNIALLRPPKLVPLLVLFLVWANVHGGFLFGLMLLSLLVFPWGAPVPGNLLRAAVPVLAAATVVLINPDGINAYAYPLEYALNSDSPYRTLGEWRPPFERGGIRSPLYDDALLTAAVLGTLALLAMLPRLPMNAVSKRLAGILAPPLRRLPQVPGEVLAAVLLTTAMSLTSRRFVILFAVAFALLATPFLSALLRHRWRTAVQLLVVAAALMFAGVRLAAYPLRSEASFHYLTGAYSFPEAIADYLEVNDLKGTVFAYYNWGGYLHWRTAGNLQVFIDGRANTIYSDEQYLEYMAVLRQKPGWAERVEASGAKYFLWSFRRGGPRFKQELLQSQRWVLLYEDTAGFLLARRDQRFPPSLRIPRKGVAAQVAVARDALRRRDFTTALDYARAAYDERPWDYRACRWLRLALQRQGQAVEADQILSDCRARFPSRYLR